MQLVCPCAQRCYDNSNRRRRGRLRDYTESNRKEPLYDTLSVLRVPFAHSVVIVSRVGSNGEQWSQRS